MTEHEQLYTRLGQVEQSMAAVTASVASLVNSVDRLTTQINHALHGNGQNGLIVRVDRVERCTCELRQDAEARRAIGRRIVGGVILALLLAAGSAVLTGLRVMMGGG